MFSRKVKMQLKPKNKDLCSEWRSRWDLLSMPKIICEVLCWRFLAPYLGRPVEANSDQIKTLTENSQCCTMQKITDILKICKVL